MTPAALRAARLAPPTWIAAAALLAGAFAWAFWPGLVVLGQAWATPEYSHGPLIPLISLWLFLRELRDRPATPGAAPPDRRAGAALLLAALCVAALGTAARIPDVVAYATIPWAMGLVLMAMGWRDGRRHWASVLHLAFMIPLPQVLFWQANVVLQTVSAEWGVWMLRGVGVPVWLEGHVIDLGVWKLEVAEACSGLRYLFPILSFSYLMGVVYRGPMLHRLLLVAAAAPVAVGLNAARIALIGAMVNWRGIEHAQGLMHWVEGWVVFGACVALLWGLAWMLHRSRGARRGPEMLDLDSSGMGPLLARAPAAMLRRGSVAAGAATLAAALLIAAMPPLARPAPERAAFAAFPLRLDGWTGTRLALAPEIERVLGATDYLDAVFAAPGEAAPVALFSAWYASQVDGAGLHSPEVCLPAGGWEIAEFATVDIGFPANRAVIRKDGAEQLVLYWFEQRGRRMTDDRLAKLTVLRDAVLHGRSDGALVRLSTPILRGEDAAAAQARLRRMMAPALERLPAFVPG